MATLSQQSQKLLRLALNNAAAEGEWRTAAIKFISALRDNSVDADDLIHGCRPAKKPKNPPYFMPFGQYKGVSLAKIPTEYLVWIVAKIVGKPELVKAAQMELEERA